MNNGHARRVQDMSSLMTRWRVAHAASTVRGERNSPRKGATARSIIRSTRPRLIVIARSSISGMDTTYTGQASIVYSSKTACSIVSHGTKSSTSLEQRLGALDLAATSLHKRMKRTN